MQLILLSGGSGKRLWPLSNSARSKQFLPLLEREDGTMESMVQRVVHQIREMGIADDITIATNASQKDIITNQLGDDISVVTEPERKDTFPAIALAASYLKHIKQCPDEEIVVIMPCDPYTETGYFETIRKMSECVKANVADLVLMGITPTYPSSKYGYVVPQKETSVSAAYMQVDKFIEKPSVEKAEVFIKQHALWNGGVFAFRLGYMMNIVGKYIDSDTFEETRKRYSELPKISFDYEVAEKAKSVAVVPYTGEWKDLGTWNTLTDELHKHVIGNAVIGSHCENTHIINELHLPIYADGLKDIVVAASPDGIIVCQKCYTENIKNAVDNLTPRPMYEERRWGTYRVLDESTYADGHHSLTKSITLNPGKSISYQRHLHRSEVWTFVEGDGLFLLDGNEKSIKAGDMVIIPMGHKHTVKAITRLSFIQVQIGNPLVEDDIERFDWEWQA